MRWMSLYIWLTRLTVSAEKKKSVLSGSSSRSVLRLIAVPGSRQLLPALPLLALSGLSAVLPGMLMGLGLVLRT